MADATCKTCPFREVLDQRREDGTPEIRCHNAVAVAGWETAFHREDFWCSEHPLRQHDRLAAMAMQGILAHYGFKDEIETSDVAKWAREQADAMLAERAKGTP